MFRALIFLWPDYLVICQRNIGRARKCSGKFFGYDPATTRNATKRSVAGRACRKTIDYAEVKEAYFRALRAEVPELLKIATGREARPPELDTFAAALLNGRRLMSWL
jgi:hypothetical protein